MTASEFSAATAFSMLLLLSLAVALAVSVARLGRYKKNQRALREARASLERNINDRK